MRHTTPLILLGLLLSGAGCKESAHAEHDHSHQEEHTRQSAPKTPHEDHGDEDVVSLTKEALALSGVQLGVLEERVISTGLKVPAEVRLNPDKVAHISALVSGQLLSVDVTLGDRVEAQAQLAKLRSVELGQARAELSRTTSLRDVAEQHRDRQRRLREEGISAERSLLEAELAYKQANAERDAALSRLQVFGLRGGSGPDMTLISPIAGVVVERHATRGENVSPEDTLFVVADLTRVWVLGRVYEQQIAQIREGMSATLTLSAYPEERWTGEVSFIGATLDESTRSLPIRVELDNLKGLLRPGLFGTLQLFAEHDGVSALMVPESAIQTLEGRTVVFVPGDEEGEFRATTVTVKRSSDGYSEISGPLLAGAQVVISGAFVLKSELMRGELGHGHAH